MSIPLTYNVSTYIYTMYNKPDMIKKFIRKGQFCFLGQVGNTITIERKIYKEKDKGREKI